MPFLAFEGCFWPIIAFMRLEVKNSYAHVIMQGIYNKFIEVNFCVGCMVSHCLFQRPTTMSLINKIIKMSITKQFYQLVWLEILPTTFNGTFLG